MNNLKIVGYFSFLTKKIYKTKQGLKIAETNRTKKTNLKNSILFEKAKNLINTYKEYAKKLMLQKPSFKRWSNIKECLIAIKEEIVLLPKILRGTINYSLK